MTERMLVTGATGFVGRRLVPRLVEAAVPVTAWSRRPRVAEEAGGVRWVTGDLLDPDACARAVAASPVVIHLAAATGGAPAAEMRRVNVEGTRRLLAASRQAGVAKFLFVSSIAVNFPAEIDYPYARSKAEAESLVRESGVPFAIVRPTIILGRGAPVLGGLRALARLPLIPMPGGGRARVQPIWVDDLCRLLAEMARSEPFEGRTVELGGPEVVAISELVRRIRLAGGARRAPLLPLPARPMVALAAAAGRLLPVKTGQLASFLYDGTARGSGPPKRRASELASIDEMLERSR